LPYLEKVRKEFKKDDNFNAAYAICLHAAGVQNNNKKQLKEASKTLDKIEDKVHVIPELLVKLTF
jgi:hypothetical protein